MPLAIDLFCGLGGWTEGLLAEGWDVVGFDIEKHVYGDMKYPAQLVVQDVHTIHGSQFKDARLIVASPPCQEFSYMAMPWTLAKEKQRRIESDADERKRLTALFDECFRIQREAEAAAGRHIPLVVENVRGAQKWVGRAKWNFGSFYLWGDVLALMPIAKVKAKMGGINFSGYGEPGYKAAAFNSTAEKRLREDEATKAPGFRFDGSGRSFQTCVEGMKTQGIANIRDGHSHTRHLTNQAESEGIKGFTPNGEPLGKNVLGRLHGSKSKARKRASAEMAKIPMVLSRHIASVYKEQE